MSGTKVLNLSDLLTEDALATGIATTFQTWDTSRARKKEDWKELYKYIYATDTTTTANNQLPWKNTTTVPKLTQIRDNLFTNYLASLFPRRKWLRWKGASAEDDTKEKESAIKAYMEYAIQNPSFKRTISTLVLDYIDNGNCFVTADWDDSRVEREGVLTSGYVGPVAKRLSPYDTVFNPTAPNFAASPKIIRSLISLGEVKELLSRLSVDEENTEELWKYLRDVRAKASTFQGNLETQNVFYQVDGFGSYQEYLASDYAEILTFYGDIYDKEADVFLKNRIIQVVDRHRIILNVENPSLTSTGTIHHSGWRPRQDNLWAMGPLDNLVGMQYRLDHLENLKADFFDLVNAPPLKIKGYVEDFTWGPFEKIYVGDDGDVEVLAPTINPLQANFEIQQLESRMEELAGSPKESMGFRTPGEKTAYEIQRLENATARIFQAKIAQFEEEILEPLLNDMLEIARRKMDGTTVRVLNDEYQIAVFQSITPEDIAGAGKISPVAARHFVEVAQRVQNVTAFYSSGIGQDPEVRSHISSIELARLFEELLDLKDYNLVEPYIRLTERAEGEQLANQLQEDTQMAVETPSGMTPDDSDNPFV